MIKKIKKIIFIFSIIFISLIFYEITIISTKTVNRAFIDINLNNIRNPQIKKIVRYIDNLYASILISYSNKTKLYYENKDSRENLPEIKVIEKTKTFSNNIYPIKNVLKNWTRNYGNSASNRFSSLKQINKGNLDQLEVAWKYKLEGEKNYDIQSNAIVAEIKYLFRL